MSVFVRLPRPRIALVVLALSLVCAPAGANEYPLGAWGRFHLNVPEGWTAHVQGKNNPGGFAIRIQPGSDVPLVLLVTPMPLPDTAPPRKVFLANMTDVILAQMRPIAEEADIAPKDLHGKACFGFYVSATDKTVTKPTLDDFKYGTQGALQCDRAFATFTVLTNLASGPEREQALEIVRSASYESTNLPVPDENHTVGLRFPGKPWQVLIDLPGFEFEPTVARPNGSGIRLSGENPKTGLIVTAFLENSSSGLSPVEHREASWKILQKNPGFPSADLRRSESNGFARLDRIVPEIREKKVQQKNVNIYGVRDELWLDVHLSKVDYTPADEALFDSIVKSIRFSD